mmetsp:Transcript_5496/g.10891  ORF Transcript_5496/g.10891 Transcript_5496/m.10891 type:complete len:100 (-) Transcript_5496:112-411(-)
MRTRRLEESLGCWYLPRSKSWRLERMRRYVFDHPYYRAKCQKQAKVTCQHAPNSHQVADASQKKTKKKPSALGEASARTKKAEEIVTELNNLLQWAKTP